MRIGTTEVIVRQGDITTESVDVIVNAANSQLRGGGGVDGAIHRVGGATILEACNEIRTKQGGCPPGQAVITTAGNLPARHVIHTVGPIWTGGDDGEHDVLTNAYRNSLELAARHDAKTIAFPSISTGVYGFPIAEAAPIALTTCHDYALNSGQFTEIRFILFSPEDLETYQTTARHLFPGFS